MHADALIRAEGLSRYYGDLLAVDGVDLIVGRGEIVGLLGPNGAGKTSTMAMLAGILAPHAGSVSIDGVDLLEAPRAAKAQVGYLPEVPPLHHDQTVDEFLGFCARLRRVPRGEREGACAATKRRCGLADTGRRLIGSLSKGYRQRVGIAQAILHSPAVVILDEPTVGLDPIQIREIRALIRTLGEDHGVILSTHILAEVQAVCERVVVIHQGRIVLDRPLAELSGAGAGLRLALRNPPEPAELAALAAVEEVEEAAPGEFILRRAADPAFCEGLLAGALERGWGPYGLAPLGESLEELFVQLTTRDAAPAHGAVEGAA